MSNQYQIPVLVEQDSAGQGDALPSYDDLAQQSGPNSRFGRWRGWIEKRAAERYADITEEERTRRRERGWDELPRPDTQTDQPDQLDVLEPSKPLYVQTVFTEPPSTSSSSSQTVPQHTISSSLPLLSETLDPTHLVVNQFGSRFLPHTMSPIRCLLSLASDRLLLIGHDEGLSVLDMFPHEKTEHGDVIQKGPDEAQARLIWEGEGVFQMSLLEEEDTGENGPHGVVLALVGPYSSTSPFSKESESLRSLRMYSLSSLINLAKWAVSQTPQGYRPLDMRPRSPQQSVKKHRAQGSITRSLKSIIDPSSASLSPEILTYSDVLTLHSPSASTASLLSAHLRPQSSWDSSWDIVDEHPLRWATDYVPLASSGSRLTGLSVRCYAIWRDEPTNIKGGAMLAVATKSHIWLYETPKGERAFRFIKDFYTPMQPRSMAFIEQSVQEIIRRPSETIGIPARFHQQSTISSSSNCNNSNSNSNNNTSNSNNTAAQRRTDNYRRFDLTDSGSQRVLFVVFDKKAGWIRLCDSVVGEVELCKDGLADLQPMRESLLMTPSPLSSTRSRRSSLGYIHKGPWVLPVRIDLPVPPPSSSSVNTRATPAARSVYLLTRGKQTHMMPCPLPTNISACPAFRVLYWESVPSSVTARVCLPSSSSSLRSPSDVAPVLQVIGLGEGGVEVQEISLTPWGKGKGKATARGGDLARSQADLGGDTGFLCYGGHWENPHTAAAAAADNVSPRPLSSVGSILSDVTVTSHDGPRGRGNQGIYAWCRKGTHDFRVFWLGGSLEREPNQI